MSKTMNQRIIQVDLEADAGDGYKSHMTTWLDEHPDLRAGVFVTIKGDEIKDRFWRVMRTYRTQIRSDVDFHGWDNNNYDKHDGSKFKDR